MIRSHFSKYVKTKVRMGIKYCHSSVFCFKTTSIHWTGNTYTPTERTGNVIIGCLLVFIIGIRHFFYCFSIGFKIPSQLKRVQLHLQRNPVK